MEAGNKIIVQKIRKNVEDQFALAEKYYSILSAINNLHLTTREIQLVAFTAIRGNMSYANIREDFCKKYETTSPTINNMISKLKSKGIMVKDKGKIKIAPVILLNFNSNVVLQISLMHKPIN